MIVEIGGGNSGIEEYLISGNKQGRLLSRDELDNRVVLSGDLELTSSILNSIEDKGQQKYLHITLSFRENEISEEVLQSITDDYKKLLFSAYSDDEYNFYAEAHLPKVKQVTDEKTGRLIERKPHIHIVIPEVNLLSGNKLLPTGYIDDKNIKNIPYLDAIQEHINLKYNLESPKDFARSGGHHSANVLSRIKGDFFGEKQSEFKAKMVDEIAQGKINSLEQFEKRLSDFGEVKIRNQGKENQYFAIKIGEDKKFTNLKHPIFSEQAIISKSLAKPDAATIQKYLDEWKNRVSKEIKFVDFATPTFRQKYAKADSIEKGLLLKEREQDYERKHRESSTAKGKRRSPRNNQPNITNTNRKQSRNSTRAAISVSGMPDSSLVHGKSKGRLGAESILLENELNHLRNKQSSINSTLRRNDTGRARGYGRNRNRIDLSKKPPKSIRSFSQIARGSPKQTFKKNLFDKDVARRPFKTAFEVYQEQYPKRPKTGKFSDSNVLSRLARDTIEDQAKRAENAKYAEIRRNIEPKAFLAHLSRIYLIDPNQHKISYAKDGSPRFNVGKQNLNASDFLTKHLNLQWSEAKTVLNFCYDNQSNKNINQENLAKSEMLKNLKAFDSDIRRYEKSFRLELKNMNIDNRNAYREEKKRIYSRTFDVKIRNQELAIASFRCMQRQEVIDKFEKNTIAYITEAKQYFLQSGYSIKSLEEFNDMAFAKTKENVVQNTISAAQVEQDKKTDFENAFDKTKRQNHIIQNIQTEQKKDVYSTDKGEDVKTDYQGDLRFKNPRLQETLEKSNIGIAKHPDGKIEYKSLTDGKLICTDDGEKMQIHQKDMNPENIKFFLEVSIDRYGNELQINGSKEFRNMVVESAAANNLPVILKPAELQEQLSKLREELQFELQFKELSEKFSNSISSGSENSLSPHYETINALNSNDVDWDKFKNSVLSKMPNSEMRDAAVNSFEAQQHYAYVAEKSQSLVNGDKMTIDFAEELVNKSDTLNKYRVDVIEKTIGEIGFESLKERADIYLNQWNNIKDVMNKDISDKSTIMEVANIISNSENQIELRSVVSDILENAAKENKITSSQHIELNRVYSEQIDIHSRAKTNVDAVNMDKKSTSEAQDVVKGIDAVYKMEFKYNKEASVHSVGKIYDVTINGQPAAQVVKKEPQLEKTLEKVIANSKDLQQKGITPQALASGSVEITKKLSNEVKITKPEAKAFDVKGNVAQAKSNEAAKAKTAKSNDISL